MSYRVVNVACGSGDAQTLCVTSDDNVWSWGDGDYGKLGHNISESCKVCNIIFKYEYTLHNYKILLLKYKLNYY